MLENKIHWDIEFQMLFIEAELKDDSRITGLNRNFWRF